jgi:hypothetical protein
MRRASQSSRHRPTRFARIPRLAWLACSLALAACSSESYQRTPQPGAGSPIAPGACRVYVLREAGSTAFGSVTVFDQGEEIGKVAEHEYVVWDRPAERGVGRIVFEVGPDRHTTENVFDLPREAGTTSWFALRIAFQGRKPEVVKLEAKEGTALVAESNAARVR